MPNRRGFRLGEKLREIALGKMSSLRTKWWLQTRRAALARDMPLEYCRMAAERLTIHCLTSYEFVRSPGIRRRVPQILYNMYRKLPESIHVARFLDSGLDENNALIAWKKETTQPFTRRMFFLAGDAQFVLQAARKPLSMAKHE